MNVVNAQPSANSQSVTTDEDVPLAITLTGGDPDGDSLTYTVTQNPAHGALSGSAPNLVYTPFANYNGPDSLKFRVNDGHVNSSVATVSITVSPVDDPPVIVNVPENTTFVTTVEATDPEHDELSYSITQAAPTRPCSISTRSRSAELQVRARLTRSRSTATAITSTSSWCRSRTDC